MSAFIVENGTINRIVTFVFGNDYRADYLRRDLEKIAPELLTPSKGGLDPAKLGEALFVLNCRAVDQRYGEMESFAMAGEEYRYNLQPAHPAVVAKATACLLYQCAEGDTDKKPLYQWLEEVEHAACKAALETIPQYATENWG